jgi:hypothetical protein
MVTVLLLLLLQADEVQSGLASAGAAGESLRLNHWHCKTHSNTYFW